MGGLKWVWVWLIYQGNHASLITPISIQLPLLHVNFAAVLGLYRDKRSETTRSHLYVRSRGEQEEQAARLLYSFTDPCAVFSPKGRGGGKSGYLVDWGGVCLPFFYFEEGKPTRRGVGNTIHDVQQTMSLVFILGLEQGDLQRPLSTRQTTVQ